jgi:hypothetical protein
LQKFFFKTQFTEDAKLVEREESNSNALEVAWNCNFMTFIKQIKILLDDPDNIFTKIQKHNGLTSIFPAEPKNIKLTPQIIDQIFAEFKMKYTHKASTTIMIVKNIYNAYFGREIIGTTYGRNHNTASAYFTKDKEDLDYYYKFVEDYRAKAEIVVMNTLTEDMTDEAECVVVRRCLGCRKFGDECKCNSILKYFGSFKDTNADLS